MSVYSGCLLNRLLLAKVVAMVCLFMQMTSGQKALKMEVTIASAGSSDTVTLSEDLKIGSLLGFVTDVKYEDGGTVSTPQCQTNSSLLVLNVTLVDPGTYTLKVGAQLDHEELPTFKVEISCSDGQEPPVTATTIRTIQIKDVNDNVPKFRKDTLQASVTEGIPVGISILRIVADDADSLDNGDVVYSIPQKNHSNLYEDIPHSDYFRVDPDSGDIFIALDIDRETVPEFKFEVQATDKGDPPLSGSEMVSISVQDMNDNEPVLLTQELHVKENEKSITHAGTLSARDPDEALNSEVSFFWKNEFDQIESTTNSPEPTPDFPFTLTEDGNVYTTMTLDREMKDRYEMEVVVVDKGKPQLSSSNVITIFVDDMNDSPVIDSECLETVSENSRNSESDSVGLFQRALNFSFDDNSSMVVVDWSFPDPTRVLYQVIGSDPDEGENGRLEYYIIPGSGQTGDYSIFGINIETGEIYLRRYFRETDSLQQVVNVSVRDRGEPPLEVYCGVSVTFDLNITHLSTSPSPEQEADTASVTKTSTVQIVFHVMFLFGFRWLQGLIFKMS